MDKVALRAGLFAMLGLSYYLEHEVTFTGFGIQFSEVSQGSDSNDYGIVMPL